MADDPTPVGDRVDIDPIPESPSIAAEIPASTPVPAATGRIQSVLQRKIPARKALYVTGGIIAALLLVVAGIYAWKTWAVQDMERRFAAERDLRSTTERQALDLQARDLLRLAARPFAWAVRAELLKGNVGQVDDYFREFVRERGVNAVLLVGPDGKILLATNRKLETQAADAFVSKTLIQAPDVTLEEAGGLLRLGVPIMGFDRRLGLLVIDYDPAAKR